jgi:O-6-methylguanine DNA methyltransferase
MREIKFKSQLPLLVNIEGRSKIEKVELKPNKAGFVCHLDENITSSLEKSIMMFLESYLKQKSAPLPPLNWEPCTPFTQEVLKRLAVIPWGKTRSYLEIAQEIHSPRASRAVGGACGRNPFLLFVPCHRVLSKSGLGGFTGGIEIKKALLTFENCI